MITLYICLLLGIFAAIFYYDKRPYSYAIKQWTRPFNITIKYYSRYTDIFECDPEEGIIYISRYNKAIHNKREYIYSIAHELGHIIGALLDEEYHSDDMHKICDRETKQAIILDEERAWDIARLLLQDAGLYEYHSFKDLRQRCISTYKMAKQEGHDGLLCSRGRSTKC